MAEPNTDSCQTRWSRVIRLRQHGATRIVLTPVYPDPGSALDSLAQLTQ
jgi:hypothetical protein